MQFQATKAEKEDTKKLLHTINKALGEMGIQDNMLEKQFEKWWPELEKKLATIPKLDDRKLPKREDRDLLEEILQLVRNLTRNSQFEPRTSTPSADLELLSLRSQGVSKEIHEIEERIKQLLGEQDIGKAQGASQELAKLTENKEKASRRLAQLQAQIAMLQQTLVTRK